MSEKKSILNLENISKTYSKGNKSESKVLEDVTFNLFENEVTGLIGPNGAGKTTLMRIIMGFEKPDTGSVTFLNKPTTDLEYRDQIGYQADLQYRSKSFSVYNYLKFHSDLYEINSPKEKIESLLEKFNLNDSKNKSLHTLSKGMRQKIELILAFLNNPKLVILDEPTSALDPPSVFELRDFISNYKNNSSTILFSSHHLTEVEKVCDRVIFIESGKIIADFYLSETEPGFLEECFRKYETERRFL